MGSMTGMYKGGRGEIYFKAAWWRARVSARHQVLLSLCNCQIPRREVERWRSTFWCTVECWGGEAPGVALLCRMQYSTQCSSVALYVKQQCNGATGTFPIPGEVLVHRSACCLVLLSVALCCCTNVELHSVPVADSSSTWEKPLLILCCSTFLHHLLLSAVLCSLKQRRTELDLQPPYGPSLTSRTLLDTCIGALSLTKALEGGMRLKVTAFWIYWGSKQVGKAAAKRNRIWWGQRYQLQGWWVHMVRVCLPTQTSSDPTTRPNVDCMQHTALVFKGGCWYHDMGGCCLIFSNGSIEKEWNRAWVDQLCLSCSQWWWWWAE